MSAKSYKTVAALCAAGIALVAAPRPAMGQALPPQFVWKSLSPLEWKVTCDADGEKTIHLPTTCDVREIFGATPAQRNVREIVETLKLGETRVYFLRPLCAG